MGGVDVFVGVLVYGGFVGTLLLVTVGTMTLGRRRGYGDFNAPELPRPARSEWPLLCRAHLFHRWRTFANRDGGRYQRCLGCGMTRDVPLSPPI